MECANSPENLHKDLLRQVGRIRRVPHRPRQQRVDRLVLPVDQPGKSLFRTGLQFGHKCRLLCPKAERTSDISQCDIRLQVNALHFIATGVNLAAKTAIRSAGSP